MKKSIFKSDRFKKARGGYSRLLEISCAKCGKEVCLYQKDGPGILKRMYLDRIIGLGKSPRLTCAGCKELLGVSMIYKKESRSAYRLFVGSVAKKIVNAHLVHGK